MAASQDEVYSMVEAHSDNEMDFFPQQDNFNCFIKESIIYSLSLNGDKIDYDKAEDLTDVKEFEIYKEHMRHHLRKQIFGSPVKPEIRTFSDFILNFQRNQPKKKLFCRFEKANVNNKTFYYLVKKYFTEGVQYVKHGEIHTYKAIGKPLYIYISNTPLELKTFRASYDDIPEQIIKPGETKIVPSNTYYFVIARCHTVFKKVKISSYEVEDSIEIPHSVATEANSQVGNETEDRNQWVPGEQTNRQDRMSNLPQPFESRNDDRYNARRFSHSDGVCETGMVIDDESTNARSTFENSRQSLQAMSSTPGPRPSTSRMETALDLPSPRDEMEVLSNTGYNNHDYGPAAFAIRKDSNIESYTLMSDSSFCILQDNTITGSFAIENDDMDPRVIEYHGGGQFVREVATFRNGSTLETTLPVQRGLVSELRDPTRRKEKVVVNYFFDIAYKSIEAAYKKFSEMRNTRMIGSCVPAIVPLSNARFIGILSDAYDAKP